MKKRYNGDYDDLLNPDWDPNTDLQQYDDTKTPWYWRADIDKRYDPAIHWAGFETEKHTHRKQRERINDLRKSGNKRLAAELDKCGPGRRCQGVGMACAYCSRQHRRWFCAEAMAKLKGMRPVYMVTLTLSEYVMKNGFDGDMIRKFKAQVDQRVARKLPGSAIVHGWIEVSFEADLGGFLPHLHAVVAGCGESEIRRIRPKLQPDRSIRAPLVVKPIKKGDEMKVMTYVVKQFPPEDRYRKLKAHHSQSIVGRGRKARPKRNPFASGPSQTIEVQRLAILAECRFETMAVFHGVKRDRNGLHLRRTKR